MSSSGGRSTVSGVRSCTGVSTPVATVTSRGAPQETHRLAPGGRPAPHRGHVIAGTGALSRVSDAGERVIEVGTGNQTRDWYSPVSVLTRTLSPSFTNGGTGTTSP